MRLFEAIISTLSEMYAIGVNIEFIVFTTKADSF